MEARTFQEEEATYAKTVRCERELCIFKDLKDAQGGWRNKKGGRVEMWQNIQKKFMKSLVNHGFGPLP